MLEDGVKYVLVNNIVTLHKLNNCFFQGVREKKRAQDKGNIQDTSRAQVSAKQPYVHPLYYALLFPY